MRGAAVNASRATETWRRSSALHVRGPALSTYTTLSLAADAKEQGV